MRYELKKSGSGCTYSIYDNVRKATILKSVSPNAKYNEEVAKNVVDILNFDDAYDGDMNLYAELKPVNSYKIKVEKVSPDYPYPDKPQGNTP